MWIFSMSLSTYRNLPRKQHCTLVCSPSQWSHIWYHLVNLVIQRGLPINIDLTTHWMRGTFQKYIYIYIFFVTATLCLGWLSSGLYPHINSIYFFPIVALPQTRLWSVNWSKLTKSWFGKLLLLLLLLYIFPQKGCIFSYIFQLPTSITWAYLLFRSRMSSVGGKRGDQSGTSSMQGMIEKHPETAIGCLEVWCVSRLLEGNYLPWIIGWNYR